MVFNGATTWAATRTKYFTAALIPSNPFLVKRAEVSGTKKIEEYYDLKLTYDSRDDLSVLLYLGPLEYGKIKDLGVGLDEIMDFGWAFIRPISKGVLYVLTEMYKVIPNYGFVLIVFSFLIIFYSRSPEMRAYETSCPPPPAPALAARRDARGCIQRAQRGPVEERPAELAVVDVLAARRGPRGRVEPAKIA